MIPQTVRCACLAAAVAVAGFGAAGMPAAAEGVLDGLLSRMGLRSHDDGIAASNGRIEAQSVDVAAKYAGRLTQVLVAEGQTVAPGDVIARIDDRDVIRPWADTAGAKLGFLKGDVKTDGVEDLNCAVVVRGNIKTAKIVAILAGFAVPTTAAQPQFNFWS